MSRNFKRLQASARRVKTKKWNKRHANFLRTYKWNLKRICCSPISYLIKDFIPNKSIKLLNAKIYTRIHSISWLKSIYCWNKINPIKPIIFKHRKETNLLPKLKNWKPCLWKKRLKTWKKKLWTPKLRICKSNSNKWERRMRIKEGTRVLLQILLNQWVQVKKATVLKRKNTDRERAGPVKSTSRPNLLTEAKGRTLYLENWCSARGSGQIINSSTKYCLNW